MKSGDSACAFAVVIKAKIKSVESVKFFFILYFFIAFLLKNVLYTEGSYFFFRIRMSGI
jgi:hypothetical protein